MSVLSKRLLTLNGLVTLVTGLTALVSLVALNNDLQKFTTVSGLSLLVYSISYFLVHTQGDAKFIKRKLSTEVVSIFGFGAGLYLLLSTEDASNLITRVFAYLVISLGSYYLVNTIRGLYKNKAFRIANATVLILFGVLMLSTPVFLALTLMLLLNGMLLASAVIATGQIIGDHRYKEIHVFNAWKYVGLWLTSGKYTAEDRQQLEDKLYFQGPDYTQRFQRFVMLMVLASSIAALGVMADSTAVVIGAMLVAPLMTPLLASSLALVSGWPKRLINSVLIALLGIIISISIGILMGLLIPSNESALNNSQIASRVNPSMVDLLIAVFAGAAGAYATSRKDVSDSVPGVAIAISLVPPLTVVGISLSSGNWSESVGALLLFTTNMLAIIFAGGFMFVISMVVEKKNLARSRKYMQSIVAFLVVAIMVVVGGLLANSRDFIAGSLAVNSIKAQANQWIEERELDLVVDDITITGEGIILTVIGSENIRDPYSLTERINEVTDGETAVQIDWIEVKRWKSD